MKRTKSKFRSLRVRVVALLVLALVPAFALMFFTASESRNRVIQETQENALRLTGLAASNQDQLIDAARDILITLAQVPAVQSQDGPACLFFLSNVLMQHPLYANFGAADMDGEIFCMTLPQRQPYNIFQEDYFQQAVTHRDFAISEYTISDINSEAMITLAYPVISAAGEQQGIVFANLDLRWLASFMNASTLPADSRLRVIDKNGTILASYPKGDFEIGQKMVEKNITSQVFEKKTGQTQDLDANGIKRMFSFTPLTAGKNSDIYVVISIPIDSVFAESNMVLKRNLLALAIGAILALVTAWFGTKFFFLDQVNRLVNVTQKLSSGDLGARTNWQYRQGELDKLAIAFDDMAGTLQQREKEQKLAKIQIQDQKDRAEALVRITDRLNTTLDLDNVLQAVCDEACLGMNALIAMVTVYHPPGNRISHASNIKNPLKEKDNFIILSTSELKAIACHANEHYFIIDLQDHPAVLSQDIRKELNARYLTCVNLLQEGKLIGRLDLFLNENILEKGENFTLLKGIVNSSALAISNAQLYTALRLEERNRADLLHKVIGAQEEERMRISRELHDETSQSLTALLLGLDTIGLASKNAIEGIEPHIQNLKSITEEMLDNVHRLISDLRPSHLDDFGLIPAIEWYGEQRLKHQGVEFHLEENILEERFARPVETTLFRIVQEGLTNALRHSNAT
ncbi:MAG: HAMP domain-containing protein, partial [Anaerolineae bacterium]|nr:HAMP domain-containing protein [Anaerolineae bacterium]